MLVLNHMDNKWAQMHLSQLVYMYTEIKAGKIQPYES